MKMRIHEIETGAADIAATKNIFQSLFGLQPKVEENELIVFDSGNNGVDFNVSKHLLPGVTQISFITDDLKAVVKLLDQSEIKYEGPFESHLAMIAIRLQTPDDLRIIINTPTDSSPDWLR